MTKRWLAGLLIALGFSCGTAQADTVASQFFPGNQLLSDNSAEVLINATGGGTILDVGDTLFGIFNIQTDEKNGVTHTFGVAGVDEFSGIFAIKVVSKTTFNGGSCLTAYCFTFGASDALLSVLGNQTLASVYGAGTLVAMFDDASVDYTRENCTLSGCVNTAKDGNLFWTLGFGANGYWTAGASTDDIAVVGAIPAPGNGGVFNSALNILNNASGLNFGKVTCGFPVSVQVDVCGSGSLLGTGGVSTPFDSFDNVDFTVNLAVPEPTSIALIGLALLGLAGTSRRRKG
jgi:hypothetical protein